MTDRVSAGSSGAKPITGRKRLRESSVQHAQVPKVRKLGTSSAARLFPGKERDIGVVFVDMHTLFPPSFDQKLISCVGSLLTMMLGTMKDDPSIPAGAVKARSELKKVATIERNKWKQVTKQKSAKRKGSVDQSAQPTCLNILGKPCICSASRAIIDMKTKTVDWNALDAKRTSIQLCVLRRMTQAQRFTPRLRKVESACIMAACMMGRLTTELFGDVFPFLIKMRNIGVPVCVFDRRDKACQYSLLSCSEVGDLSSYITGYYDEDFGFKTLANSFKDVESDFREKMNLSPQQGLLYVTSSTREARAAEEAGWMSRVVLRCTMCFDVDRRTDFESFGTFSPKTCQQCMERKLSVIRSVEGGAIRGLGAITAKLFVQMLRRQSADSRRKVDASI